MTERGQEPEEEEEENGVVTRGNAFWGAGYHARDAEVAGYGGAFRGVPAAPHGGTATVTASSGSMDYCWCGQPFGHDWPGKDRGAKHPRKETTVSTTEAEVSTDVETRIERRSLRAYHADLADIVVEAVNNYGAKFRITKNGVVLFPPDGSQPYTVHARNSDRQVKGARMWFVRHCVVTDEGAEVKAVVPETGEVDVETLKELAATVNSEEHRPDAEQPVEQPAEQPVETEGSVTEPEWVPYIPNQSKGGTEPHEFFVTNGIDVRCTIDGWVGKPTGTGGHTRTKHRPTENFWGAEARERAVDTFKAGKVTAQVQDAITLLQKAIGQEDTSQADIDALLAENLALQAKVVELETTVTNFEAKQSLMREALGL